MPETRRDCARFSAGLLAGVEAERLDDWHGHLARCADCRAQLATHRLLEAAFAREPLPELSSAFDGRLFRRLASPVRIRPLDGWRLAAMWSYAATALGLFAWALRGVSLPAIDLSATWVPVATLLAVPLTLWLGLGASRWLPQRRGGFEGGL